MHNGNDAISVIAVSTGRVDIHVDWFFGIALIKAQQLRINRWQCYFVFESSEDKNVACRRRWNLTFELVLASAPSFNGLVFCTAS
jgi:hypothetical protein